MTKHESETPAAYAGTGRYPVEEHLRAQNEQLDDNGKPKAIGLTSEPAKSDKPAPVDTGAGSNS